MSFLPSCASSLTYQLTGHLPNTRVLFTGNCIVQRTGTIRNFGLYVVTSFLRLQPCLPAYRPPSYNKRDFSGACIVQSTGTKPLSVVSSFLRLQSCLPAYRPPSYNKSALYRELHSTKDRHETKFRTPLFLPA